MLKVSICPAVPEDAEAIAVLNENAFGRSFPVMQVRRQIETLVVRGEERVLVAVYRGKMIGYIHARDDRRTYRAPRKEIVAVAVDKDYRRQGVGKALFEAIADWAKKDGCEAVDVAVGGSKAAQCFFAACGCEERLNRKQFIKSLEIPKSPFIERLEDHGKKE